jgi:hypothetical protein
MNVTIQDEPDDVTRPRAGKELSINTLQRLSGI